MDANSPPISEDDLTAQLFRTLKEDLKHEFYTLYIANEENENDHDNNDINHHNHRLMEIRDKLYFACRSRKKSAALVEKGLLSQADDVDDAWMVLFYTQLLQQQQQQQQQEAGCSGHYQQCTTWESMNKSVRNALALALPPVDRQGDGNSSSNSNSLVLELLLDSDAVQAELLNHHGSNNDGHGGLLHMPQKKVRFDTTTGRQEMYIAGGLFELQSRIKAMRRDQEEEEVSTTAGGGGGGGGTRPKKRRRRHRMSGWDDNQEAYAQLSLAYILDSMIYDVWIAQRRHQQDTCTIASFLETVRGFQRYSPVLDNALLSSNAPFWFLFDLFMRSCSDESLIIPVDLDLAYLQRQLCGFGSGVVPVLAEASGCCVSEQALKARCAEQIMNLLDDGIHYNNGPQQPSGIEQQAILQACAAIKGQLFLGWSLYLEDVVRKKKKHSNAIVAAAVEASPPQPTLGRGTKRRSLETDTSKNINDEDSCSLPEMLMKPEYPLMILLKLLLLQRELVPAILQATKMEESNAFAFPVIYACFKEIFEYLIYNNRLFDTRDVPPQESLLAVIFPLCTRLGTLALSRMFCGVLERIQMLQQQQRDAAHGSRTSSSWSSKLDFARRSCIRTLLQLLCSKYTLKGGLEHYEKLREDQFSTVLEGPLNVDMAKDICQHEIQVPASGFPNLARLLQGQDDDDEMEEEVVQLEDVGHDGIAAGALGGENDNVVVNEESAPVESDNEFHDAQMYLPTGQEAVDHGHIGAEKSQGEAQQEARARIDATSNVIVQPARQERGDDDDGYEATAEESQGQEDDQDYGAGDSQGHDSDDEDDHPGQPPDAGGQKVEASGAVHPAPSSSRQQPVTARTDDSIADQDHGYDAEESQGHSDDSDKVRQTDNGYDGEESQVGHCDTEEGSVEHELAAGPEAATALSENREQHVTFAPVPPVAAQSEDDAGYLPDEHTEDETAIRNERDGYQGGESSVHTEEEGDGSEAMRTEDEEDAKQHPLELHQQADGVNESLMREPRRQPSHSSSDMSAADDERHLMGHQGEEYKQESSDSDDDDSGDGNRHFPPSSPRGAASGQGSSQRSSLHDHAVAAQDAFSPASARASAGSQQDARTPGSDQIIINCDSSSETESEESSDSSAPESPSGRQEAQGTPAQEDQDEGESALSVHSSPSRSTPDRKPAAAEASLSPYGDYDEDDGQYAASSVYSSPIRSSPDQHQAEMATSPTMDDEDEDKSAPGSARSRGSLDLKQPAEETSPTYDVEGDGISTTNSSPSRASPDGKQAALETSPSLHAKADEEEAVEEGTASDNDVDMVDADAEDGPLADTGAGARPSEEVLSETPKDLEAQDVESDVVDEPAESMNNSPEVVEVDDSSEDMDSEAIEAAEPSGEKGQGTGDDLSGGAGAETTVGAVPRPDAPETKEVEMLDEQATPEDDVNPIDDEGANAATQQADADDGNEEEVVDSKVADPLTEAASNASRVEDAGVEASGGQEQDAGDSKAHVDLSIDGNREAEEGKGDNGEGQNASTGEEAPDGETKAESAVAVEKETVDNVDGSATSGPKPGQEAGDDDDKEAAMDSVEDEPTPPNNADEAHSPCSESGQEASSDKQNVTMDEGGDEEPTQASKTNAASSPGLQSGEDAGGDNEDVAMGDDDEEKETKTDVAVEDEAEHEDETDEKASRAGEMHALAASSLEPIPEQEEVVDHEHGIHEISTSHPTAVDEDLGEHPSDQEHPGEGQEPKADNDTSAAHSVGTAGEIDDDDNASRQSRTLRRSARKKEAPKTPSPARKHGDASASTARRTRSSSKNADTESIASHTRSHTSSTPRRTRSNAAASAVADDVSVASHTRSHTSSTPRRTRSNAAASAVADDVSVASHTRSHTSSTPRRTRSNAAASAVAEDVSVASRTRSHTSTPQRRSTRSNAAAGATADNVSVASNTRSRTSGTPQTRSTRSTAATTNDRDDGSTASRTRSKKKPPPSSSGKPPRAPPSSKKK